MAGESLFASDKELSRLNEGRGETLMKSHRQKAQKPILPHLEKMPHIHVSGARWASLLSYDLNRRFSPNRLNREPNLSREIRRLAAATIYLLQPRNQVH